jgi:hypothetical protein
MRLITRGPGPHPDVSVAGKLVIIGGETYDTEGRQKESEQLIDLRQAPNGDIAEASEGFQVASVQIPPYRSEEVETGEVDDEGNPVIELQRVPLNPDQVVITLWTIQR